MTETAPIVGVLFVNFHSEMLIAPRAVALRAAGLEVVVVDNSGTYPDGSGVRLVRPGGNVGFAAACNLGRRALPSACRYVCFHNPDVDVPASAVVALARELANQEAPGAIAPIITTAAGVRAEGHRFPAPLREIAIGLRALLVPRHRWISRLPSPRSGDGRGSRFAEGSLLLVDLVALDNIGGFDDRYFLYGEDLDLWHRLEQSGRWVGFSSTVHIEHSGAQGSPMSAADREVLRWVGIELFSELHEGARWRSHRLVHRALLPLARCRGSSLASSVSAMWRMRSSPADVQAQIKQQQLRSSVGPLRHLRVHLVHRSALPSVGGVETQFDRIARHLSARGADVHLWTATPGAVAPPGTRLHSVGRASRPRAYAAWVVLGLIARRSSGRREVVVAGRASVEAVSACVLSAVRGWRTVVYLAGGSEAGPEFANQRRRWVRWLIGRYADEMVGHTCDAFDGLPERLPHRLIPVIVERDRGSCDYAPKWGPGEIRAVWCARNHSVKDPGRLRRIAEDGLAERGIATLVVTDVAAGFEASAVEVHLNCPEPRSHFAAADVAILTSRYEAQPNVLAEAAMEGCPFVAFDVGGLRESVEALRAGEVVEPSDDAALVAGVVGVVARFRDGTLRTELAQRARERHVEAPKVAWEHALIGGVL